MVRRLRARFTAAALKEGDDGDDGDVQKEIQAIGELIIALGGKQSASADKVWSFSPPVAGSSAKAASKAPQPVLGAAVPGAPVGHPAAAKAGATAKEQTTAAPSGADGFGRGDSPSAAPMGARLSLTVGRRLT